MVCVLIYRNVMMKVHDIWSLCFSVALRKLQDSTHVRLEGNHSGRVDISLQLYYDTLHHETAPLLLSPRLLVLSKEVHHLRQEILQAEEKEEVNQTCGSQQTSS